MAKNESRSRNASLDEGATDGTYRKARPNTDAIGFDVTEQARRGLSPSWNYGTFAEAPVMRRPDGVIARRD